MSHEISFEKCFDNRWTLRNVLNVLSAYLSFTGMLIAVCALIASVIQQRESKAYDLMSHFHHRYDTLVNQVRTGATDRRDALRYYDQFWGLQLEQYVAWRQGLLPADIYSYWMECRITEYRENAAIAGVGYREGWEATKARVGHGEFVTFMDGVLREERERFVNGPPDQAGNHVRTILWWVFVIVAVTAGGSLVMLAGWSWHLRRMRAQGAQEAPAAAAPANGTATAAAPTS